MSRYQWKKLVRDKIVDRVKNEGHQIDYKKLSKEELSLTLLDKLEEELTEVKTAQNKQELTEELADLQQIIDDICQVNQISLTELKSVQAKKKAKKGGFTEGFYVESVEIADPDDPWIEYFENQPDKYPKIN